MEIETSQTKRQKWQAFTREDKISIVHDVIVNKLKVLDVARRYHRSQGYISNIVKRAKENRSYLRELIEKKDQQTAIEDTVKRIIRQLLEEAVFIKSA